jgi:hypothetical protein
LQAAFDVRESSAPGLASGALISRYVGTQAVAHASRVVPQATHSKLSISREDAIASLR